MASSAPPDDSQTLESPIPPTCSHLPSLRSVPHLDLVPKRIPNRPLYCSVCLKSPPRLYACLTCFFVTCRDHAPPHAADNSHHLAVDIDRKELFCCVCLDQVYDREFDSYFVPKVVVTEATPEKAPKKRRVEYSAWSPDAKERAFIAENTSPLPNYIAGANGVMVPRGLRGLSNLGSTCFMNSILQALLRTMPLRDFFLAGQHDSNALRLHCEREIKTINTRHSKGTGGSSKKSDSSKKGGSHKDLSCLVCDLDDLFTAAFGEEVKPYAPARFLTSWWKHAGDMATYEEQDAHEFFLSVINVIHDRLKDKRMTQAEINEHCSCIAHRVFYGKLRSDITCSICGSISTSVDSIGDIELALNPEHKGPGKQTSAKSNSSVNNKEDPVSTLTGCLDRYTQPEKLVEKISCQKCKILQESVKQLSIKRLPLVYCFNIKRFQVTGKARAVIKNNRYLQFPFLLDMAPYLSSAILRSKYGNRMSPVADEQDGSSEVSTEFELFAVVSHMGGLHSGHYVTYLRFKDEWYKCDDAWVTRVDANIVRSAQGYMMFYVQKMLYYAETEKAGASS